MKLQNLSTRAFLRLIVGGASLTSILLLFILYAFTKDIRMILGGFSVMILLFLWGAVFCIISRRNYRYLQMDYAEH